MGEVSLETAAYAKIILHAAKYPHCAVNGVLLADATKIRDGAKNQDLDIVDTVPLFHHSHYLSPMAEIALTQINNMTARKRAMNIIDKALHCSDITFPTPRVINFGIPEPAQIETVAQTDNRVIAGYYAACENFKDNTVEKCPGQKIAEKIAEHFPSAVFIVVDNKRMMQHLDTPAIKLHKYNDGKWKLKDANKVMFQTPYVLETVSHLLQRGVQKDLVDFDNYLDDLSQDWTNLGIEKLIASINASNTIDCKEDEKLFR